MDRHGLPVQKHFATIRVMQGWGLLSSVSFIIYLPGLVRLPG